MDMSKKQIFGKVLQIMMILSVLIFTVWLLYSPDICIRIASIGNAFFLFWIVFGDPLKSGIAIRIGKRNFVEFFICAIFVWGFSYMSIHQGLCGSFSDMASIFGKYF
ncbi:MAG: hypothetical protein V1660_01915 [archaeon]